MCAAFASECARVSTFVAGRGGERDRNAPSQPQVAKSPLCKDVPLLRSVTLIVYKELGEAVQGSQLHMTAKKLRPACRSPGTRSAAWLSFKGASIPLPRRIRQPNNEAPSKPAQHQNCGGVHPSHSGNRRSRSAFRMTVVELNVMAAAASIGLIKSPKNG